MLLAFAFPLWIGCATAHREIPFTSPLEGTAIESGSIPIRLSRVTVGEGGLLRPAIYWKPSVWTLLPLPEEEFREKVRRLLRAELDRCGFGEDPAHDHSLDVVIEELALFTRGRAKTGYRQGYARLSFTLRSAGEEVLERTLEGEARFAGSRVRRAPGGSLFRTLYIYERKDPEPSDFSVRLALRSFLDELREHLPQGGKGAGLQAAD